MGEEQKEEEKKEEEPPEIVLKVDMHCEACARKVLKSLRKIEGVEAKTDSKSRTVVIKGKGADPGQICERIQKKTGRKVELISPLPKPPEAGEEGEKKEEAEAPPPPEEPKEEPKPITVTLKVGMHCEKCAQVLQRRIKKMEGVESVVADMASSQVTVTGFVDPEKLAESVHRRTRKQASLIVHEEEKAEEAEKKEENGGGEEGAEKKAEEGKEGEEDGGGGEEDYYYYLRNEMMSKYGYWPQGGSRYNSNQVEYAAHTTQSFSDENPNACSLM